METKHNSFSIRQLSLMSGLTDRTIRNYIASGILQGEKSDGVWSFSPEQVRNFFYHPAVRPSILAKQNAIVYDFLQDGRKKNCEICMILDLPEKNKREIMEYFCSRISSEDFDSIHFSFDGTGSTARIILKGRIHEVLDLVNGYTEKYLSPTQVKV